MSPLSTPCRPHPKAPLVSRLQRRTATALASAVAISVLSGAAIADPAPVAAGSSTMNFAASFDAPAGEARRPSSSLLAKIRQVRATEAVIEPAGAQPSRRALAPEPEDPGDVPVSLVPEVHDPLEPVNRLIFGFNEILDVLIMRPVSHAYRTVVPQPLRLGVANALHNFASPVIFANDVLQGNPDRARTTFVRFMVNSTAGFGGLVDAADAAGLPRHSEDFGRTLAVWGVGPGPYLVLPVFGPSTARDAVGIAVDTTIHPATWLMWDLSFVERSSPIMAYTVSGHEAVMDEAQALRRTSPDFYATVRDIYTQRRAAVAGNGLDEFDLDALPPIPTE